MLKLRKILLHRTPFYLFLLFGILIAFFRLFIFPNSSALNGTEGELMGILEKVQVEGDNVKIILKYQHERIVGVCYLKNSNNKIVKKISVGDYLLLTGKLKLPSDSRVENGFSYKNYLKGKKTYYLMDISDIKVISEKKSLYYILKELLEKRMKLVKKSSSYLHAFILGDNSYVKEEVRKSFQKNGISHLFAISGMHVSIISGFLLSLLKKFSWKEKQRYIFVCFILFIYLTFTFSPSILRAFLFFLLFSINRMYYFYIKPFHLFLVTFTICLLINPYFIYMIGFQYSFLISGSLIIAGDYINEGKNYFHKLLRTSLLSFFSSIIISLFHFYELNFLSIIYNLFYVPFITFIIFPLCFFVLLFPFLDSMLFFFLNFLEKSSLYFSSISFGRVILGKPSNLLLLLYAMILFFCLWKAKHEKKFYWFSFCPLILVQFILPILSVNSYFMMFDVGQGDSILLKSRNKIMLIDTGGIGSFSSMKKRSITEQVTIPYLKSKGIRKIDILILTHGDYDHLGETENLIKQIPVKKIYINNNSLNYFERRLKKKYSVEQIGADMTLQLGDILLYSLNDNLQNENDSSIVLLAEIFSIKILLMGDASCKTEEKILDKYDIGTVDILKVGHHGSKTSSCEGFLSQIQPHYAFISAGEDNKFGHPHQIVLERFQKRKIKYFITSKEGSIKVLFPSLLYTRCLK